LFGLSLLSQESEVAVALSTSCIFQTGLNLPYGSFVLAFVQTRTEKNKQGYDLNRKGT